MGESVYQATTIVINCARSGRLLENRQNDHPSWPPSTILAERKSARARAVVIVALKSNFVLREFFCQRLQYMILCSKKKNCKHEFSRENSSSIVELCEYFEHFQTLTKCYNLKTYDEKNAIWR